MTSYQGELKVGLFLPGHRFQREVLQQPHHPDAEWFLVCPEPAIVPGAIIALERFA